MNKVGLMAYLMHRLETEQIEICCIQESRLSMAGELDTKKFHCVHTPAKCGKGGLLPVVARQPHIQLVTSCRPHPRLQMVKLRYHGVVLHVLNSHAPTRDSPWVQHEEYQQLLISHMRDIPDREAAVLG
eukprot:2721575-Amphidinium_carterae.1